MKMQRIAKFSKVSWEQFVKDWRDTFGDVTEDKIKEIYNNIKLPKRSTAMSAGHDISIPFDTSIKNGEIVKIPTGIRCKMDDGYVMFVFPRSSMGIKKGMVICNTIPVIDGDYFGADNEGHIFICVTNTYKKPIELNSGDNIVQAVFTKFGVADDEEITEKRFGGVGSTGL